MLSTPTASIQQLLDWTTPHLPSQLVADEYKERLARLAALLPPVATELFVYEIPLGEKVRWVDLSFGLLPTQELYGHLHKFSAYANAHAHCIEALWLEYDVGSSSPFSTEPNVIVKFVDQESTLAHLEKAFMLLLEKEIAQNDLDVLHRCLVDGFRVHTLMFTTARSSQILKFRVHHPHTLSPEALLEYLQRIGVQVDTQPFLELYGLLCPFLKGTNLYLGIEETLLPRVDVCCPTPCRDLLESLQRAAFLNQADVDALLSYEGEQLESDHFIAREIGQLKVSFVPGRPPKIKAYLGGIPRSL